MNSLRSLYLFLVPALLIGALTPMTHAAPSPSTHFRVISHNLWNGFTERAEPRRTQWRAWMKDRAPDVAALQELNGYTTSTLEAEARLWGHEYVALLKEDGHPTALTSRTPITGIRRIREGMHHGLLYGKIRGVHFYVIHFHPSNFQRRIEEARLLVQDIATLPEHNPRVILIGDFNGFSPQDKSYYAGVPTLEPFFALLDQQNPEARNLNSGRLDYGGIAEILGAGFVDLTVLSRPISAPFAGTFPTELRRDEDLGPDRRIDYIFISPNLVTRARFALVLRDPITQQLSDHYPLMAEFDLTAH